MASVFKQNSANSTNLQRVGNVTGIKCYGYNIVNTNAAIRYVKIYWGPPGNWSSSGSTPTVGTDVPSITVLVPATSTAVGNWVQGNGNQGEMWMSTTTGAADSDATAVGAGDLLTSLFYG